MVPARSHKVPRVSWYSGSCLPCSPFAYGAFTLSGRSSQNRSARFADPSDSPYPGVLRTPVWAPPRSLAATGGITFVFEKTTFVFFSSGYLDVSVHRVPPAHLWIQCTVTEVSSAGFPHSDICGSLDICSSPQLFAAYHVFLRLSVPRHPPCALSSLSCWACSCIALQGCPLGSFLLVVALLSGAFFRRQPRMSFLSRLRRPFGLRRLS